MNIDLTTMSYEDLKALAHDIQLKIAIDQQQMNAVLHKVTSELESRVKVMPQSDKDLEAAALENVIAQLQKS